MRPLTLDDLIPLKDFAQRRSEYFDAHSRYLARYRRVRVGPQLTLVFENRQTLWFRVHELLRIARLSDPARVQQELDWYNQLLPAGHCLQAALVIDAPEDSGWEEFSGENLRLVAGDSEVVASLVTCRPDDRCFGMAHWMNFATTAVVRANLADRRKPARLTASYRAYEHQSPPLGDAIRGSLLQDLEGETLARAA
jgi:hypothetical protein